MGRCLARQLAPPPRRGRPPGLPFHRLPCQQCVALTPAGPRGPANHPPPSCKSTRAQPSRQAGGPGRRGAGHAPRCQHAQHARQVLILAVRVLVLHMVEPGPPVVPRQHAAVQPQGGAGFRRELLRARGGGGAACACAVRVQWLCACVECVRVFSAHVCVQCARVCSVCVFSAHVRVLSVLSVRWHAETAGHAVAGAGGSVAYRLGAHTQAAAGARLVHGGAHQAARRVDARAGHAGRNPHFVPGRLPVVWLAAHPIPKRLRLGLGDAGSKGMGGGRRREGGACRLARARSASGGGGQLAQAGRGAARLGPAHRAPTAPHLGGRYLEPDYGAHAPVAGAVLHDDLGV